MAVTINQFHFTKVQQRLMLAAAFIVSVAGAYICMQAVQQSTASAAKSCVQKIFKQGSKDTCVKYMQQMLNASDDAGTVSTDGVFGSGTRNAVVKFQKAKNLSADGIVGSGTWKKLCTVSGATSAKQGAGCTSSKKQWVTLNYSMDRLASDDIRNASTVKLVKNHTYRVCATVSNYEKNSDFEGSFYVTGFGSVGYFDRAGTYCTSSEKITTNVTYKKHRFGVFRTSASFTLSNVRIQEYK